ncbi:MULTISPECIES: TOPRIM nucleotidyl transferase/hydrolase domain-containing protein [Janibacter]|uniref:OLD protein-like TOPRIM domain-containing protein n=1 Tax=Janibacter indicus TaxID=857417 RepID=A0A1W1ZIA4_9MICO|nr:MULTISPECIES: TOPRIM nucleotidyl transferase/hydrolase domain-containing protein [Janibacter]QNF93608.1 ATP-dependent endonuclease [Janibacter sp. YB324]SMC48096.1 hypothetical protein SAMN06296429_1049 [Janibacter indicus]
MSTPRTVLLVEGESDRVALHALAHRRGEDLAAAGVEVVAMGGITNLRSHALRDGPRGRGLALAGLYDVPEEHHVRRGLLVAGVLVTGDVGSADIELAEVGFHACDRDLEDELLRAVGPDGAQAVIEAAGEATSLRLLAQMPSQRGWTREEVLRRFLTSQSGRKARYARLLVEALDLDRAPAPLVAVLEDAVGR